MRYHSYLNSAATIIRSFKGDQPFAVFIKKYFSANKKYGGKDRKQIAALCYNFYRLGKTVPKLPVEEKIIAATFLCETVHSDFLHFHKPEWNEIIANPTAEKLEILGFTTKDVFSFYDELSAGIEFEAFGNSFFIQPDLFLRIRPGREAQVLKKLQVAGLQYELLQDGCIALSNSTKLDAILDIDKEVIIQDYNSQRVLDGIKKLESSIKNQESSTENQVSSIKYQVSSIKNQESSIKYQVSSIKSQESSVKNHPLSVWDCCAASGGKSILAYDILKGEIELTVSDIRESILSNLKKRFETAGIKNYNSFIADLATINHQPSTTNFQLVICDAPCTGSGTWSRTPEQLYYFKKKTIDEYVQMQQSIVSNVIPHVQQDGFFIYITCSVFKKENEEMADFIKEKFHLQLLQMELLKGYDKKADSMFVAVFKKG